MIAVFYIGQGETLPYHQATIRDVNGVVDLGSASAYFLMARISTGSVVVSAPAVITDAANGQVEYRWSVIDTTDVGDFAAAYRIYNSAGNFSLPRNTTMKIIVEGRFAI